MNRKKLVFVAVAALMLTMLFCGCVGRSPDELYALPRQSEDYYDLQSAIDHVMAAGTVFSAPVSGVNQQAVQLADLDGDGQDEALAFLRTGGERPLKICVFDRSGESFESVALVEGDGSAFDAVEYADLDGQPGMEMICGRQVSNQVTQSLSVYSWREGHMVELMNANYAEFRTVDLNGDECKDVFLLRDEAEERFGVAELYCCRDGLMEREREATLSAPVGSVRRIISGLMCPGVPAVFVASDYDETSIITDIFALHEGAFRNVSAAADTGLSTQTVRNYNAYATDIDGDGIIELPSLVALPSQDPEANTYWTIDWYNLYTDGARHVKLSTYHNHSAGWYLELPGYWHGDLTVTRSETEVGGVRGLTFAQWKGRTQKPEEIFTLYAFTGEDRETLATEDGRFVVARKGETIYAASMGTGNRAQKLGQDGLKEIFKFIQINWNTGEV